MGNSFAHADKDQNSMGHRVAGILPAIRGRDALDTVAHPTDLVKRRRLEDTRIPIYYFFVPLCLRGPGPPWDLPG
jgi:hypothetical protein